MAEEYGFYNGDTLYGQDEFNRYFNKIYESGLGADEDGNLELAVTKTTGGVSVAPGYACVRGFYYNNTSPKTLTVTPDSQYTRIDRVVIQANLMTGPITVTLKQGTAGSNPQPPALERDDAIWELSLARVTVTPAGSITVADERFDVNVCGAVRPKYFPGYTEMVAEFERRWEEWFASQQGEGQRNIYVQADAPEGAVDGSIWIDT